jgi:hypothetical protein
MKSLSESPAILTVHAGSPGQFVIRVGDLRYRPLIVGVTKLLPDAESLVIITPQDIKVYAVGAAGGSNGSRPVADPSDAGGAGSDSVESAELDADTLAAIAKEEGRAMPGDAADVAPATAAAEVVGETPQGTKVVRRKKSPTPIAGHEEACQRCGGAGRIKILLDGGSASETGCPICRGEGTIRRYGSKR